MVHREAEAALCQAFAKVEQLDLLGDVLFWGGSWVPRRVRGSRRLSRHSWGIAFDLNPSWNRLGRRPADVGQRGTLVRVATVFESFGFAWGGRWRRPDGMHFEFAGAPVDRRVKVQHGKRLVGTVTIPRGKRLEMFDRIDDLGKVFLKTTSAGGTE